MRNKFLKFIAASTTIMAIIWAVENFQVSLKYVFPAWLFIIAIASMWKIAFEKETKE